jgi:hypothetical protein
LITYDHDRLINSLCASASDTPVEPDIWAIFDPVAGRIVIQRPPPPSPSTTEDEDVKGEGTGEREGEEKAGVKGKGKGEGRGKWSEKMKGWVSESCENGQTGRPAVAAVAAARKSARKGKGGKGSVSYVCSNCREVHSQWWGSCRYCNATRTVQKCRDMVLQSDGEEEGEGGESEDEEKAGGKGNEKGKRNREGQGNASGEKGIERGRGMRAARRAIPGGCGSRRRGSPRGKGRGEMAVSRTCAATAGRSIPSGGAVAATATCCRPFRSAGIWCCKALKRRRLRGKGQAIARMMRGQA